MTRLPLIVPYWNRDTLLFPLLASLTRAYIDPADVWLCADDGSAEWIDRKIAEDFPWFHRARFGLDPQQGPVDGKPWAKSQWHCVRSVNRVLELTGQPAAFYYLESDCIVARTAFLRLGFLWDFYRRVGKWQPLARIGGYRGRAWKSHRTYVPRTFEASGWVEDLHGGCWFGLMNADLWRAIMRDGRGDDGPYDPRRVECDLADSFFDRNAHRMGARFLRTPVTIIQHQGMTDCLNPDHWPAEDFVGEQA